MEFFEKLFFLELVDYEDELEAIDEVAKGTDKNNSEANGTEENDNDKNGAEIEEEEEKGITRYYSKIVFNLQTTPHITLWTDSNHFSKYTSSSRDWHHFKDMFCFLNVIPF